MCQTRDTRIGGLDDHVAICNRCGHAMIRLDHDIFAPYWNHLEKSSSSPWEVGKTESTSP